MGYVNSELKVPLLDAIDRLTILELKQEHLINEADRPSVEREIEFFNKVLEGYRKDGIAIKDAWFTDMKAINAKIWDVEADIRIAKKSAAPNYEDVGHLAVKLRDCNDARTIVRDKHTAEVGIDFFETGDQVESKTPLKLPLHESIDRVTIASLKVERLPNDKNHAAYEKEFSFYTKVLDAFRAGGVDVKDEWISGMKAINARVWDKEGAIRQGREKEFGLEEMGRRTLELRDIGKERVAWKKKIAQSVGSDFYEVKV